MQEQQQPQAPIKAPSDERVGQIVGYGIVLLVWLVYAFLTFRDPAERTRGLWNLSAGQLTAIRLTVALPYLFIWLAAAHGVLRLRAYARTIGATEHGRSFRTMATGLSWLAAGMILPTVIGSVRNLLDPESARIDTVTIIVNFIYVYLPLVGFGLLYRSTKLLAKEKSVPESRTRSAIAALGVLVLGAAYVALVLSDVSRQAPVTADGRATYALPDIAIFATIALPAIISWLFGFLSVQNLYSYINRVSAVIYEKTLPLIARGITSVIASTVFLQGLLALGQHRLLNLGLGLILVLVYLLLGLQTLGYLMIARGAQRLSKLDKILGKYQKV